jgi:hypothetical protein
MGVRIIITNIDGRELILDQEAKQASLSNTFTAEGVTKTTLSFETEGRPYFREPYGGPN